MTVENVENILKGFVLDDELICHDNFMAYKLGRGHLKFVIDHTNFTYKQFGAASLSLELT